jgi:hypothetical protein
MVKTRSTKHTPMKLYTLACALSLGLAGSVWAAGQIDTVQGEANIIDRDGAPHAALKGARVNEGDTVATGASGEVIVLTDDSGVLAIRPLSRLVIEKYEITGTDKDVVALRLLRGALRSITGWISKTSPRNYKVITATSTIGIRGTDHETVVTDGNGAAGSEAGTYDRVYSGETSLETAQGSVFLQPGQTGQARSGDSVPTLLPKAPAALYPERATDNLVQVLKQEAQGKQASRLEARQEQNRRSGGTSSRGNPAISAQCTPDSPAQRALDEFLRAYEQGNIALIQKRMDPSLIGYSVLVNDMMRDANAQKQMQIRILDRQMQCGPDVSVVDFSWEKRFIDIASFQPQLQRGRVSVLISGLGSGASGQWRISGFTGDNPLRTSASPSNLTVSPATVSYSGIPGVCTVSGTVAVTANQQFYATPPTPTCSFAFAGTCNYSNAAITSTSSSPPPGTVTACTAAAATLTVTVNGSGSGSFSGVPGGTATVTAIVPASGVNGAASTSANLTCSTTVNILGTAPCTASPTVVSVTFTVTDSARAGQSSVPVQVAGANGDRETLRLNATTPGTFTLTTLPIQKGAAVIPGSGRLEFSGPTSFTIGYSGANGVQVVRAFSITP